MLILKIFKLQSLNTRGRFSLQVKYFAKNIKQKFSNNWNLPYRWLIFKWAYVMFIQLYKFKIIVAVSEKNLQILKDVKFKKHGKMFLFSIFITKICTRLLERLSSCGIDLLSTSHTRYHHNYINVTKITMCLLTLLTKTKP